MSRAVSIARLIIGFLFVAVTATVFLAVAVALLPWRVLRIKLCNYYGKMVGYGVTRLAGGRPVIHDAERLDGSFPAIYVANHTSTLDAFLSIWLCPVGGCGVMKKEVVKIPFFGLLYLLSGHLRIDRGRHDRAVAALADIAKLVREKRLGIWIMPEGTRSKTARLLPFKTGFVHLAIATGLPVVPVVIHGAHRVWELGTFKFVPTTIDIDVLPPVDTSAWRAETSQLHADQVHDLIAGALREDQRPLPPAAAA